MTSDNQIEISEVQKMIDETLQQNVSVHSKNRIMSTDNQNIDQALAIDTNTNVSLTDPSFNTKQFSLLYGNKLIDNEYIKKRHIMISYNRSSVNICRKIYNNLVERNYKVWMDLDHMFDDILVAMARAVENSYIVLLCINQEYYESNYCRLEAEYVVEKRIKFIPCLMEESFHPKSWLGIIKGSNLHIDFSSPDDFNESFEQLIRQITFAERKLSLQPHTNIREYQRSTTNQSLSDEQFLLQFLSQTLEKNELLLKLVDHLTRQQNRRHNFDVNSIIKATLTIALLWWLVIFCQKL